MQLRSCRRAHVRIPDDGIPPDKSLDAYGFSSKQQSRSHRPLSATGDGALPSSSSRRYSLRSSALAISVDYSEFSARALDGHLGFEGSPRKASARSPPVSHSVMLRSPEWLKSIKWNQSRSISPSIRREASDTAVAATDVASALAAPGADAASGAAASGWILSLAIIACGCACQAPVELMLSSDRGCGDLISLAEAIFGLLLSAPAALSERRAKGFSVPLHTHVLLACSSVAFTMLMNRALASPGVPAILLLTLKNGGLVANALVGYTLLGKRFSRSQMAAILTVCAGLVLTAKVPKATHLVPPPPPPTSNGTLRVFPRSFAAAASFFRKRASVLSVEEAAEAALAVTCACGALLARALSGAMQESALARASGRASASEMLFFRNLLALPAFALRASVILHHAQRWMVSSSSGEGGVSEADGIRGGRGDAGLAAPALYPRMWLLLLANLVFDYACKVLMTRLIATDGALHATLALTMQKFCAFLLSAMVLSPGDLGPRLWLGALFVLAGSLAYSTVCNPPPDAEVVDAAVGASGAAVSKTHLKVRKKKKGR